MKRQHTENNVGDKEETNSDSSQSDEDGGGERDDINGTQKFVRLGKCEVCADNEARYTCPKCEVKTCSIRCVQIHKKELECDGMRDRTKFLPLRKMTKMDFMNDYYFLEECTRFTEDRKYDRIKHFTRFNKALPQNLFRLRSAAAERGTKLRFLLQNFSRCKENTTYYDWKKRKIFWRIEWIFINAGGGGLKYIDERCDEDEPLHRLLEKYMNPDCLEQVPQKKDLECYQSVGVFRSKIMLKSEGIKRSRSRFYMLDAGKTLKENLKDKTLVEFPCIYVSYETKPTGFDIIDSDEDVEAETKSHQISMHELRQKEMERMKLKSCNAECDEAKQVDDSKKLKKILLEKQREERQRKREEFEKTPNNYLFADEKLWEMFSSSDSSAAENDGNSTEEEKEKIN